MPKVHRGLLVGAEANEHIAPHISVDVEVDDAPAHVRVLVLDSTQPGFTYVNPLPGSKSAEHPILTDVREPQVEETIAIKVGEGASHGELEAADAAVGQAVLPLPGPIGVGAEVLPEHGHALPGAKVIDLHQVQVAVFVEVTKGTL